MIPTYKLNSDQSVAVSCDSYWLPIESAPHNVKIQLLGGGGVAVYGTYDGKPSFWTHWGPLLKKQPLEE